MIEFAGLNSCPVCHELSKRLFDFLIQWYGPLMKSVAAGRDPHDIHGICPFHLWQVQKLFSPAGFDEAFSPNLSAIAAQLENVSGSAEEISEKISQLSNDAGCDACEYRRTEERRALAEVAGILGSDGGREAYEATGGLCLPHLPLLLPQLEEEALIRFAIATAARRLRVLARDMVEFAWKHRELRRDLVVEAERMAHVRSAIQMAGVDAIPHWMIIPIHRQSDQMASSSVTDG